MGIVIRSAVPGDAPAAGKICFEAFRAINEKHGFPPDFPAPETAIGVLSFMISHPGFYVVVAERGGEIVGSNALDERSVIPGIGPITVDSSTQNTGVGRMLMDAVLARAGEWRAPGVRLVQAAFHSRSLSLYLKLGFEPREPLSVFQGPAIGRAIAGYPVRPARADDIPACNALCERIHGHTREGELRDTIDNGATVVEHEGRVTGYATGIAFFSHAVAETNRDLQALIAAAHGFGGPGFLAPTRNGDLMRWCLDQGLRVIEPMTLMTRGLYNEPCGAFLPSIAY
jgi:predicted N-acetyltransferase YhbS